MPLTRFSLVGRRRLRLALLGFFGLYAVLAAVAVGVLTVAWRSEVRDRQVDQRRAAAELRSVSNQKDAFARKAASASASYRALRSAFDRRVRSVRSAAYDQGWDGGYDAAFTGYDEPWLPGHWYVVKITEDGDSLSLGTRSEVSADSGIQYSVENDDVYTYGSSSSYAAPSTSAPGGYNAAGCPKDQWVNGYFRSDGTYVSGYWRNSPSDSCDSSP